MKTVPINDFAIVYDRERGLVVDTGTYGACQDQAFEMNDKYQSRAYVAQLWEV